MVAGGQAEAQRVGFEEDEVFVWEVEDALEADGAYAQRYLNQVSSERSGHSQPWAGFVSGSPLGSTGKARNLLQELLSQGDLSDRGTHGTCLVYPSSPAPFSDIGGAKLESPGTKQRLHRMLT